MSVAPLSYVHTTLDIISWSHRYAPDEQERTFPSFPTAMIQHPTRYGWKGSAIQDVLYDSWWGSNRDLAANTTFEVDWRSFPVDLPSDTEGRFFVRQEYLDFYSRLAALDGEGLGGCVVSGSPGIGKSVFLVYVLVRRLKERQITLFYTSGHLYLFYTDGIYALTESFNRCEHLRPWMSSTENRLWILIDTGASDACPSLSLTWGSSLFPIQASSPNDSRYHGWLKREGGPIFIMNPWGDKELQQALALHERISKLSDDDVRKAREAFGPCIRDVYYGLRRPDFGSSYTDLAIARTYDVSQLILLADGAREAMGDHRVEVLSHQLFTIYRISSDVANYTGHDHAFVEWKTPDIARRLLAQFPELEFRDLQRLYRVCSPFPEISDFAGWLFEKIAIRYFSGRTAASCRVYKEMYPMKQTTNSDSPSFAFTSSPKDTSQLRVAPWAVEIVEKNPSLLEFHQAEPVTHPILSHILGCDDYEKRTVFALEDLTEDSTLTSGHIYVPKARNHRLFDAVLFSPPLEDDVPKAGIPLFEDLFSLPLQDNHLTSTPPSTLWVVQMTTSARRGGAQNGYDDVRNLRARLPDYMLKFGCEIKYVLVVPERQRQSVVWKMPVGWQDDVEGEVYVQFVAMDVFLNAPS